MQFSNNITLTSLEIFAGKSGKNIERRINQSY
jgi:hypothetical protein